MSDQTTTDAVVLRLTCGGETLFTSGRPWLHPLLDLTAFLVGRTVPLADCLLYDKIIGRAAALMIVRLGIGEVHTDLISRRAIPVFEEHGVRWQGRTVVDRIDCQTEDLLADEHDPQIAYRVIRARGIAARAQADPEHCAVRLEALHVVRGETPVLTGIDLRVGFGEKVLVTGANGAGKTTLLKTILGTIAPSSGRVVVAEAEGRERRVGYVNQESVPVSFPVSSWEVVAMGVAVVRATGAQRRTRVREAMAATGTTALAARVYGTLSGGEKQRIAIARCLAQQARILLLDEPTASLDGEGKRTLVSLVERLADDEGITVIMVTHEADAMDRSGWRHVEIGASR